jgi:hypothetical protein
VKEGKRSFQELNTPDLENTNRIMQAGRNAPPTARGMSGMQMGCFATLQPEMRRDAGMSASRKLKQVINATSVYKTRNMALLSVAIVSCLSPVLLMRC